MPSNEDFNLRLPKRYERLQTIATQRALDITKIVRKVPDATSRVERLLKSVRDGGLGRFEFFLGESGSGKTTFLSTIDNFYQPSKIFQIPDTIALIDVADYIENKYINGQNNQIFVLLERDNPDEIESNVRRFFENLRRLFRKSEGQIVLLWPITDKKHALSYSEIGWEVGRDSVVDSDTRGIYNFTGLPKNDFEEVADITARSFNEGRGLEVFGLNSSNIPEILSRSLTISDFYGNLEKKSQEINLDFDKLLKKRSYLLFGYSY